MAQMKTPGVYIIEKNAFPNSVVEVATAIPAFIGHTQFARDGNKDLTGIPFRISSMAELHSFFGFAPTLRFGIRPEDSESEDTTNDINVLFPDGSCQLTLPKTFYALYYNMLLFYANGGGPCYIVSVGDYEHDFKSIDFTNALLALKKEQEPTLVVVPEAVYMEEGDCYKVQTAALMHCGNDMKNRFAILDVFNGYKDENYVELALLAQKMGRRIFLVVEKLNELRLIADISKRLKIRPNIGIRIKLASSGSGKWEESGGDGSKFGLNSSELLEALDFLEKAKMTDCLKLIHFHIGSQITKIRRIKNALKEASQFYVQLQNMGFHVEFVDIGGGLGVDYDGTRSSSSESSMNYSIQEYVNDSVSALVDACAKNNLPQPNIITESGRSLTAHHSVLVFEVLETTSLPIWDEKEELGENPHELVDELYKIWDNMNQPRLLESWHDALQIREEALDLFGLGLLDLRTRAQIEQLFWSVAREVNEIASDMKHAPEELRKISKLLPDKYFCNFSLFQSLPDSWSIDQLFPIMPISRLDERPDRTATIQDITCDSDGKINNFISSHGANSHLAVHALNNKEP